MARSEIDHILDRIDVLATEIKDYVKDESRTIQFRADLAGLLVVAIAASYESCVKETLISYASRQHIQFGEFAQNHFKKLNSRISLSDLKSYTNTFDSTISIKYTNLLNQRRDRLNARIGRDCCGAYTQLLNWRHAFAHAGVRNTTIAEALNTHRLAKRVIYAFNDAFT